MLWHCWLSGSKGIQPVKNGGWWRWALLSPDGVAPSRIVGVSASVNLLLHHKVLKFSSGTGSPGWSRKKGRKAVVVWCGLFAFTGLTLLVKCQEEIRRARNWLLSVEVPMVTITDDMIVLFIVFLEYRMVAFISHMGTSTKCGHYVCHILRDDQWVIFNDEKVALSERPPKDLAYIFLYQRL